MLKFPKPQWRATTGSRERLIMIISAVGIVLAIFASIWGLNELLAQGMRRCGDSLFVGTGIRSGSTRYEIKAVYQVYGKPGETLGWVYDTTNGVMFIQSISHEQPKKIATIGTKWNALPAMVRYQLGATAGISTAPCAPTHW